MQVVIDIPEKMYQKIKNTSMLGRRSSKRFEYFLFNVINTGTPLPKGHGDLIDADKFIDILNNAQIKGLNTYEGLGRAKELLIETHTIIEADKAESEVQEWK